MTALSRAILVLIGLYSVSAETKANAINTGHARDVALDNGYRIENNKLLIALARYRSQFKLCGSASATTVDAETENVFKLAELNGGIARDRLERFLMAREEEQAARAHDQCVSLDNAYAQFIGAKKRYRREIEIMKAFERKRVVNE